jgi:hypothetical protein
MFSRIDSEEIKLFINLAVTFTVLLSTYCKKKLINLFLCLLLAISFIAYSRSFSGELNFKSFRIDLSGLKYTWLERIDSYDLFHYYLNVKYFKELGYFSLYPAMLTADLENNGPYFKLNKSRKFIVFQDKYDYHWVLSQEFLSDKNWQNFYKNKFSPERWQQFSSDFLYIQRIARGGLSRDLWNDMLWDHGFNGTPAWTASVYWVTQFVKAENIKLLCHYDSIFVLLSFGFVYWAFGGLSALIYCIYIFSCYSGRWPTISWSLGRFDYVSLIVITLCLLKKNFLFLAGITGAWAGSLRIFPFVWFLGPIANFISKNSNLNSFKKLFLGGIVTIILLWGGALWQFGQTDIIHYFKKMTAHTSAENLSSMRAGFALGLAYDADFKTHRINHERRNTVKEQKIIKNILTIILVLSFMYLTRNLPLHESFAYGFIPFFLIFTASYYYYITRATLIIIHSYNLGIFRHRICLGYLFAIEAISLYLILNFPEHRVTHIGVLSWLLIGYVFLLLFLLAKENNKKYI